MFFFLEGGNQMTARTGFFLPSFNLPSIGSPNQHSTLAIWIRKDCSRKKKKKDNSLQTLLNVYIKKLLKFSHKCKFQQRLIKREVLGLNVHKKQKLQFKIGASLAFFSFCQRNILEIVCKQCTDLLLYQNDSATPLTS